MAKFAIFSKLCSINNLYRIARNEETKNHYFLDDLYAKILLTDQQYLDLIKRNKKISFDFSTNQMNFENINFEQELINSGFEVKYIDALNSDLEKKGIIDRIDLFLNNRKSNEPDYNYWQSAKTNLNNFNVNSVNYSNNYKNFQEVLEASGQDIIDSILIP